MIPIMSQLQLIFEHAPIRQLAKGQTLFRQGDRVQSMFLVVSGSVALERPLANGTLLTLHTACELSLLAEASLFAGTYHCDAIAREASQVAVLPRNRFLEEINSSPDTVLKLLKTSAHELQANRARIEILRMRRVADRLAAWLDLHGQPRPGEWVRVADEIGVTPAALYRELAKLRR